MILLGEKKLQEKGFNKFSALEEFVSSQNM